MMSRLIRFTNVHGETVALNPDHVVMLRPPNSAADPPGSATVIETVTVKIGVRDALDDVQRRLGGGDEGGRP